MWDLIIPSFLAGLLTFLAPCTLPMVPSYLGFISGVSLSKDVLQQNNIKRRIVINSLAYVFGFSLIFILLGTAFAWGGSWLSPHRLIIARIGGLFVIFFGLFMLHALDWPWLRFLYKEKRFPIFHHLKPGKALSSFLFGAFFAFGWTPCIGPILGTILFFAASTTAFWPGVILLTIFSLGLGLPFIIIALAVEKSLSWLPKLNKYLPVISTIGGVFLIFIGVLMLTNTLGFWSAWLYDILSFIPEEVLLKKL